MDFLNQLVDEDQFKLVKVMSLEYSGSTIFDICLSNYFPDSISLGEVFRSINSSSLRPNEHYKCSCDDENCNIWKDRNKIDYKTFLESHIIAGKTVIDSSKSLSSLRNYCNDQTLVIFLYRNCADWCRSCRSRLGIREVTPFASKTPHKFLLAYVRIEILRKLRITIPFEWLYRNLLLFFLSYRLAKRHNSHFVYINFDDFLIHNQNKCIHVDNVHVLRGNKISRKKSHCLHPKSNTSRQLNPFDLIFNSFILCIAKIQNISKVQITLT